LNKAVLFDLDGVLVDACDWHYEALNRALKEVAGYEVSRQDHETTYNGLPTKVKLKALAEKGLIQESDIERISELKQELTVGVIEDLCTVDFSKTQLMARLKKEGYKLACVTNSIRKTARLMLKNSGVLEYLDCVISNEDVCNAKPHPEGYIKALVMLNCLPQNAIIVEDSPKGIQAAKLVGAKVVEVANATEVNGDMKL
jgi:beta-phosphoglucomutase-like phosphatase (HAD superfamily)